MADDIGKHKTENSGDDAGIFSAKDGNKGKGYGGWCVEAEFGDKGGNIFGPVEEFGTEFIFEEPFFGKHYSFVINPKYEREDEDKKGVEGKNGQSEPNEVIAEIKRMANHGINAGFINDFGHL